MGGGESKSAPAPSRPTVTVVSFKKQIRDKFSSVRVDRSQLKIAEAALKCAFVTSYDSSLANDKFEGVSTTTAALTNFADIVVRKLGLELESNKTTLKNNFLVCGAATKTDAKMEEFDFIEPGKGKDSSFTSMYGFLVGRQQSAGRLVDIGLTVSRMSFKVRGNAKFNTEQIKAIKNHYCKMKALESLKQEAVIETIVYIN